MIRIKPPLKYVPGYAGTLMQKHSVTASVTETPKRNAMSNAERQRLFRQRKFLKAERERMRGLTDAQFLAETVNADG